MVEGKLNVWIKSGSFTHTNDLYMKVEACIGDKKREMWKTDEKDSSNPKWDSTVTKHVKGDYEKLLFSLMDEDTFSRDDLIGSGEISFASLEENPFIGDLEIKNADGEIIGTVDLSVEYEAGDVGFFQLQASRMHTSDSD